MRTPVALACTPADRVLRCTSVHLLKWGTRAAACALKSHAKRHDTQHQSFKPAH